MKQITAAQAMAASFTPVRLERQVPKKDDRGNQVFNRFGFKEMTTELAPFPRFIKAAEPQEKAIKRLMAGLKREAQAKPKRVFPTSSAALASPQAYVREYYRLNNLGNPDGLFNLSPRPTEYPGEQEVLFEEGTEQPDLGELI